MRHVPARLRVQSPAFRAAPSRAVLTLAASSCIALSCLGCGSEASPNAAEPPAAGSGVFESADPGSASGNGRGTGNTGGASASADGAAAPEAQGASDDAARAIEEADIIKLDGDKLYALSQNGGLSVIDVSRRDELLLLGRHKVVATPFEMYVRGGIVVALYNGYGEYSYDKAKQQWNWYQTSYVIALDARSPESIQVIGRYAIPGNISDSRIVGNVLYVAAYENGSCWGCGTAARTTVISLDMGDPAQISKVDEIGFPEQTGTYSWKRSLTATDKRLYIAGPTWGANEPVGSTIQVIDISDPSGTLREGAAVNVSGQIESRWQMDESEGVLRVVSQPFSWRVDSPPVVQTFEVVSSSDIRPLGQSALVLPRAERLQSVRFDGPRGYAITFEQTDPLFTIDLSDPRKPRQVGELEMPGWLYHMEPRGDRLLGLGYDQGNAAGAITVSLFDVSDLTKPSMLSRVNFGGQWGSLAEDQDRIHKAFNVLPDAGLLLVPFAGWSQTTTADSCGSGRYLSGVQLVDWADDTLALRGVAEAKGQARRGFIHDERLFAMSDERIEAFDISNRDKPLGKAVLPLAQIVNHSAVAGGHVVRIGSDWWTNTTELDVTTLADASIPSALGRLSLPALDQSKCYSSSWLGDVASNGDDIYLVYQKYDYDPNRSTSQTSTQVLTVDASNPAQPKLAADTTLDFQQSYWNYYGQADTGKSMVSVGSTLVFANRVVNYDSASKPRITTANLKLADLRDPRKPRIETVELPPFVGATGLLVSGTSVFTSHFEPLGIDGERGRFYLDSVDLSDPSQPVVLPSVNIPGSLLAFDDESSRAITLDYRTRTIADTTGEQCSTAYAGWLEYPSGMSNTNYQTTLGVCHTVQQTLRLIAIEDGKASVVDSYELETGERVGSSALGDDRFFVTLGASHSYYGGGGVAVDSVGSAGGYYYGFSSQEVKVVVMGGIRSGAFSVGRLSLEGGDNWGYVPLAASGQRAVLSSGFRGKLTVLDGSNPAAPKLVREVETAGAVQDLDIAGSTAVASLGHDGVETIRLDD